MRTQKLNLWVRNLNGTIPVLIDNNVSQVTHHSLCVRGCSVCLSKWIENGSTGRGTLRQVSRDADGDSVLSGGKARKASRDFDRLVDIGLGQGQASQRRVSARLARKLADGFTRCSSSHG
mmetsp:Transcript_44569/g.117854  ORF Transcript_44569/g.117854 Transcript_44569/m.117854 type:complete len:120 (-) Transcript_44569:63-422(-)